MTRKGVPARRIFTAGKGRDYIEEVVIGKEERALIPAKIKQKIAKL